MGSASVEPTIVANEFGTVDGKPVELYTLTNRNGLVLKATNYGAIITAFEVPDRNGVRDDIVLGFDDLASYVSGSPFFGAIVGRVANRIKGASFELEGQRFELHANDGKDHLHGGKQGWDKVIWQAVGSQTTRGPRLELSYLSRDGEEGYPGNVGAVTAYTLTNDDELEVEMSATTDRTTLVNMAHHTYWNLAGASADTILEHELTLSADSYTPGDPMIPDGRLAAVEGTPFDFRSAKGIGRDLREVGGKPVGYDHNFVVSGEPARLRRVAKVKDPKSGRVMTLEADQPGVQFYSGNFLDGSLKGKGKSFVKYAGFCLETQKFPNAINVPAWSKQVVLGPGQRYSHRMIHAFTVE